MRPKSPLGSDTSRFIIFQVRFPSLQLYSRSKRIAQQISHSNHRFTTPQKCHVIVAFIIAQGLIHLSTRRSLVMHQFNSIITEQFLTRQITEKPIRNDQLKFGGEDRVNFHVEYN